MNSRAEEMACSVKGLLCRLGDPNLMSRTHDTNKSECDGASHGSQCYTGEDRKTPRPHWPASLTNSVSSNERHSKSKVGRGL